MAKSKRIAVAVSEETLRALGTLAQAEQRSISWYVDRLLRSHLLEVTGSAGAPKSSKTAPRSRASRSDA